MEEVVIGTAILDRTFTPQRLLVLCQKANGDRLQQLLPVYPKGSPKPEEVAWEYRIEGDILHITPSLLVRVQIDGDWRHEFHNTFNWSVRFKDASYPKEEDWKYGHMYRESTDLNPRS